MESVGRITLIAASLLTLASAIHIPYSNELQKSLRPASSSCKFQSYTSLGDSYAGGFGSKQGLPICGPNASPASNTCTTQPCAKDEGSYAYRFAHKHDIQNFQFFPCVGTATRDIADSQVKHPDFGTPDLITVNAGGDDQSFFREIVESCVYFGFVPPYNTWNETECNRTLAAGEAVVRDQLPTNYDYLFTTIQSAITGRPNVKVLAMSYIHFWNSDEDACESPWSASTHAQKKRMNDLAVAMNQALQKSAVAHGFEYVDVDRKFENHRWCNGTLNANSYIQPVPHLMCFPSGPCELQPSVAHPTLDGQSLFLEALEEKLGC